MKNKFIPTCGVILFLVSGLAMATEMTEDHMKQNFENKTDKVIEVEVSSSGIDKPVFFTGSTSTIIGPNSTSDKIFRYSLALDHEDDFTSNKYFKGYFNETVYICMDDSCQQKQAVAATQIKSQEKQTYSLIRNKDDALIAYTNKLTTFKLDNRDTVELSHTNHSTYNFKLKQI